MTERDLQHYVASMLDRLGFVWAHPPNEGYRSRWAAGDAKRSGMKAGLPDCLVFGRERDGTTVPFWWTHGVAIELKVGKTQATPLQRQWHENLAGCAWTVRICRDVADVLETLAPELTDEEQRRERMAAAMTGMVR